MSTTRQYDTITDLIAHEGPGLADYVTRTELDALIDGTMPVADIADRYYADTATRDDVTFTASDEDNRAGLLSWVRSEIEINAEWREEDAREAAVAEVAGHVAEEKRAIEGLRARRMELVRRAVELGARKVDVARAAGVSRPTLDAWLDTPPAGSA